PDQISTNSDKFSIHISPQEFQLNVPIDTLHEKWFKNLTDVPIPEQVRFLLQLGDRFNMPVTFNNKQKYVVEYIKHIERNISKVDAAIQHSVRSHSTSIINDFITSGIKKDSVDTILVTWLNATKQFVKDHPEILFTRADKGNITVAMKVSDYHIKMDELLSDTDTYITIKKDPSKGLMRELRDLLVRRRRNEYISERTYKSLLSTDGVLPRAYGLPKVHKLECPLRIIVSSVNSPLFNIADFLHKIIQKNIDPPKSHIQNSFQLVDELCNIELEPNYQLASLDVISLFTNVPLDSVIHSLKNRWNSISGHTPLTCEEFLIGIRLVLNSTYFKFNNQVYKQIFGTPMGSPLSPIVASIVLQDLEEAALKKLSCTLPIYYRYVDDILLAAPSDAFDHVLNVFNSFHKRLKFTLGISSNNQINFLDVSIMVRQNTIYFDWYHKPTFSGRIAYSCHHPLRRFIKTGKDKLEKLAHSDVVYKIPCKDCDATYVGQTKRQLGTRVKEHYNDIKRNLASPSVISCHRMDASHEFDWESVSILDEEPSYHKRLISEMIHIKRQVNSLNNQTQNYYLKNTYQF
ncbi:PREDICTED: uncharacterized protein LOC105562081, partial [Vollenhovia emeryi]|uniref:uncharacterized protein LOC105562081 n=1 Tax=Vollenhovia emeryi TaxID=411798 RepID=UPI0005F4C027